MGSALPSVEWQQRVDGGPSRLVRKSAAVGGKPPFSRYEMIVC